MSKRKKGGQPENQNARKHGFYSKILTEAQKVQLEDAIGIEGLDDEIALLRVKLRDVLETHPEYMDLQLKAIATIARLVSVRYKIAGEQKHSLKDAVAKVLTEIAVPLGIGVGVGMGK